MRILLMPKVILKTGVGLHVKQLYNELTKQGHEVWIASSCNDLDVGKDDGHYVQIATDTLTPWQLRTTLGTLHRLIVAKGIVVVHCHHRKPSLIMRIYNTLWHIPVAYTLHSAPIPHDLMHRLTTWCGNCPIAVSQEVAEFMRDKLGIANARVVTNGVDEAQLTPLSAEERQRLAAAYNLESDTFVVAMHGRICDVKNHLSVAKAMQLLPAEVRQKIVVLCSGEQTGHYYHTLDSYIKTHDLTRHFHFCGWQSARDVTGAADLLISPSTIEGFALNCIEAMMLNVPVMRTKTSGYADMATCVRPISSHEPQAIADALTWAYHHRQELKAMAKDARQYALSNFTCKRMTHDTVEAYKSIAGT